MATRHLQSPFGSRAGQDSAGSVHGPYVFTPRNGPTNRARRRCGWYSDRMDREFGSTIYEAEDGSRVRVSFERDCDAGPPKGAAYHHAVPVGPLVRFVERAPPAMTMARLFGEKRPLLSGVHGATHHSPVRWIGSDDMPPFSDDEDPTDPFEEGEETDDEEDAPPPYVRAYFAAQSPQPLLTLSQTRRAMRNSPTVLDSLLEEAPALRSSVASRPSFLRRI